MLKKLIIYLLAASIILSVPVSYAETIEDTAKRTYSIYLFEALGIIDNAAEYAGKPDAEMTRGEFAILASGLYNGLEAARGYQAFTDVPDTHKAAKAVNLLASNGIISGTNGNRFEPDRAIEYTEALSIILKMLGYGEFINYNGGYPAGCQAVVNKFKLFDYAPLKGDATVSNIFTLLFEAAKENVMEVTSVGNSYNTSDIVRDKTLLSIYFDIYHTEGVLTNDGLVDLKSTSTPHREEITIDGTRYFCNDYYGDLLGQTVVCFYEEKQGTKKNVVFMSPTEDNEVVTVKSEDAFDFTNMLFRYEDENGKAKKITINNRMDIICNYSVVTQLTREIMIPENGEITFINNDNDSDYDVVIIKSYSSFLISSVSAHDEGYLIYGAPGRDIPMVNITENGENDTLIYKNGIPASASEIKAGVVASVAGTITDGVLNAREIILCDSKIFGDVTGYEDEANNIKLIIDETTYSVASSFKTIAKNIGFRYGVNLYLDFMGNITDIAEADMSMLDIALGYIIDINYDDTGFDTIMQVKMLTEASKIVIYDMAENVTIDGVSCKGTDRIYAALGGEFEPQMVTYKISESREIIYIDTAAEYTGEIADNYYNRLTCTVPMRNNTYYQKEQFSFDGIITMDASTRVFIIPPEIEGAADDEFEVVKNTDVSGSQQYTVEAYSLNNDRITADAVVIVSSEQSLPTSSVPMAITQISKVINELGEETYSVTLMGMKGEEKYTTAEPRIIETALAQSSSDTKTYELEVGDIVRITLNKENEINKMILVYDYDEGKIKNGMSFNGSYFSRARAVKASVYSILGNYMQITDYDLSTLGNGDYLTFENLENQNLSKFKIVKYDTNRGKLDIQMANATDLVSYKNNENDYSDIIIYTENALERIIFILE